MNKKLLVSLIGLFLLNAQSFVLQAADFSTLDWVLSEERSQVKVYTRGVEGDDNGRAVKAITFVDQSPMSVLALVVDYPSATRWRKQIKSMEKIKQLDNNNWYIRTVSDLPWPLSDRVSTLKCKVEISPDTQSIAYHFNSAEKGMRLEGESEEESIKGIYEFVDLKNGKTRVTFEMVLSSAIKVPDWLISTMMGASFVDQLVQLREVVQDPKYSTHEKIADNF